MKAFVVLVAALAISHVSAGPLVSPAMIKAYETKETLDIMIIMKAKTASVLAQIETQNFINTNAKVDALYKALNSFTAESQRPILDILSRFKSSKVNGFYISNRISVRNAPQEVVTALLDRDDIEEIREAKVMHIGKTIPSEGKVLEWGVSQINGPEAWAAGYTGNGIVVSNIDTGVRVTHVALQGRWREEYGWYDPDGMTPTPRDNNGHGTHTMGSMTGGNGTGVAPGATWIACVGCSTSSCTENALFGCGQWTFCPTRPDNTEPNCDMRPHISSNSWGGGNEDPFYDEVINMWNSVGIIPVFAIGNSGPACRTANSPGDRPNVISVGATNQQDDVAVFSSHGPSAQALRIKPEVSAPGSNIRSCGHTGDSVYTILSGTSMATPHVAGAIALLMERNRTLSRDQYAHFLQNTTVRKPLEQLICNGGGVDPVYPWPNNSYGWGRIDIWAALQALIGSSSP
jgi:subtilisin family serine protease